MTRKIMIVMALSSITIDERSCGGVDSVCQLLLKGIAGDATVNEYFILGFNPADDTKSAGEVIQISKNIKVKMFDVHLNRRNKFLRFISNFIWQNLIIRKEFIAFKPNIIHVHVPSWLLFNYKNVKKILTLHSYGKIGRTSFGFWNDFIYEKFLMPISVKNADIVTTLSKEIQGVIGVKFKRDVKYIPDPVNDCFFNVKRIHNKMDEGVSIIMTGAVVPGKRVLDGLKVVASLRLKYPSIKLFIAGKYNEKSPYYLDLKRYIIDEGIEKNVVFLGALSINELMEYYSKVTLGIFLSENETFGLAPLEMMAARIPIVTTNIGVFKWYEGEFGNLGVKLVEVGDINRITTEVTSILNGREIADNSICQFIRDKFSIKKVTKDYLNVYAFTRQESNDSV